MSKTKLYIIKIGGNVIDDPSQLDVFLQSFARIDAHKILVHGGGKIASSISKELGIVPDMVDGRRITDAETLRVVTMVYGGLVNKNIVAKLQAFGCNAIGLTGADANILPAHKRPLKDIDYGFVGDIEEDKVDAQILATLLESGLCPVVAPLTHDRKGNLLNTNADTIASVLAISLSGNYNVSLIYCFEKAGVLRDVNDESSLISSISSTEYENLKKESVISLGMIPKLDNAFGAIRKGVKDVQIINAAVVNSLATNKKPTGTELYIS